MSKQTAAQIRSALKAWGWGPRQVSVRARGGSVDVVIKDSTVPLSQVDPIARGHERISRCEYTHEILSGGNTYVSVRYDDELVATAATEVERHLSDEPGRPVVFHGIEVWRLNDHTKPGSQEYCYVAQGSDTIPQQVYSRGAAANAVAVAWMAGGYKDGGSWVRLEERPAPQEPVVEVPEPKAEPKALAIVEPAPLMFGIEDVADCSSEMYLEARRATRVTLRGMNELLWRIGAEHEGKGYAKVWLVATQGADMWRFRLDPNGEGANTDVRAYAANYVARLESALETQPDHWAAPNLPLFRSLIEAIDRTTEN